MTTKNVQERLADLELRLARLEAREFDKIAASFGGQPIVVPPHEDPTPVQGTRITERDLDAVEPVRSDGTTQ